MGGNHTGCQKANTHYTGDSWVCRWEPRSKTVAAVIFVAGVISLNSFYLVAAVFLAVLLVSLSAGFPFKFLLTRIWLGAPILLLMAVTISLGGGFPPTAERVTFAGLVLFKALTSIIVITVMLKTQPLECYFKGLAHMKLPTVIVTALFLAHRYIYLLSGQLANTQRALAARLFRPGISKRSLAVYGETAGGLLLKAVDRSDSVYRAMVARGFDGRLHTGRPLSITKRDYLKCVAVLLVAAALFLLDWRWFV